MNLDAFLERLSSTLRPLPDGEADTLCVTDKENEDILPTSPVEASVLIPILVSDRHAPSVLFTRRTEQLKNHGGQISFPGGRREPADRDRLHTALRESEEEVGIRPNTVQPMGCLQCVHTITGFGVIPFVATVTHDGPFKPDPVEVDEIITVPLTTVLDRSNYTEQRVVFEGRPRTIQILPFDGHTIWGATARMLMDLLNRVDPT